jgi:hypothetical protein
MFIVPDLVTVLHYSTMRLPPVICNLSVWLFLLQTAHSTMPETDPLRPNIVFILTDDQDLHLNSLDYLPFVQKHLIDRGTSFTKHYCTVALCCPSRVTLWTGKHAHNTASLHSCYSISRTNKSTECHKRYATIW